jgi:hypothetical protein
MLHVGPAKTLFQTALKRTNGETAIQSPYIKVTVGASPATASGFLLVSLSKIPRPGTILPAPNAISLGRAISDQG